MNDQTVAGAAHLLLDAEQRASAVEPITDTWSGLDLDTAYRVQEETLARRIMRRETVTGIKLGLTSRAKQVRMGIDTPLTAWLTDAMAHGAGEPVPTHTLIHPRVEPEIVFVLGERLAGPGVTAARALGAVRSVHAGLEIIDSRFRDFRFRLPDVVADNASSGLVVTGSTGIAPADLDLALEACVLEVDGEIVHTATGAAVQGDPAQALALAANTLGARGIPLEPGWLVFTGGMTDAVPIAPGSHVVATFTTLGTLVLGAA
ncbi:fumarylacetoacetate hydrolase family protein [Pseudonocardia kongjuensis]|uniref:Fumarylacetoacetate hydrolase family protein n=1 Tax=Pseudonocardia kongjuensis TaxID=102227 RepID=A0ABP4I8X5_9PSEU